MLIVHTQHSQKQCRRRTEYHAAIAKGIAHRKQTRAQVAAQQVHHSLKVSEVR